MRKTNEELEKLSIKELTDEVINFWKNNSWSMDGEEYIRGILFKIIGKTVLR